MEGLDTRELVGRTFACLPGCGFCCTFPPEASRRELALLRARVKPKPLGVTTSDGRSSLALHNKCGACTMLERRECQVYDLRPAHCRYFPFHVHFARTPEAYVNYTCRGVVRVAPAPVGAPLPDLHAPFAAQVLANAKQEEIDGQIRDARAAYAGFERNAKRLGAWGDVAATVEKALAEEPFTRAWMERALAAADEELTPEEMVDDALAPFSAKDVTKRPFYLAPDLRWLTFDGPTRLMEMDERGHLTPVQQLAPTSGWEDPGADLLPYLRELTRRGVFEGSVFAVVDDHGYETTVEEATWWRLAEVVADLSVRARILRQIGVAEQSLADEVARFYDSTFLDTETIGGVL